MLCLKLWQAVMLVNHNGVNRLRAETGLQVNSESNKLYKKSPLNFLQRGFVLSLC